MAGLWPAAICLMSISSDAGAARCRPADLTLNSLMVSLLRFNRSHRSRTWRPRVAGRPMKEGFDVAAQVRDALARDLGTALRFRQDERALQHRLRMKRETLGAPGRTGCVQCLRGLDVLRDVRRMGADIGVTGLADRGMRVVGLLHHGAEKACERGDGPVDDGRAEIDVAEQAIQWIGGVAIGCRGE